MTETTLDPEKISFKPLDESDLVLLHKWLNTDFVAQWYKEAASYKDIEKAYLPCIRGEEKISCYVIRYGRTPIGYIQMYLLADFPDYDRYLSPDGAGAGLDLYIGKADYFHKGLGSSILKKFLIDIVFASPRVTRCIVDPDPRNSIAIRAYQKAGFTHVATVRLSETGEEHYLMEVRRLLPTVS